MKVLKNIFHHECLLLIRNKFYAIPFLINIACWSYFIIAYEAQSIQYEEVAAVFYQGFIWMLLLNLLMVGLIATYMAGKDRESHFEQLVVTYRVQNSEWLLGKWFVTQFYGISITLVTVMIQFVWFISSAELTFSELVKNMMYVFVQMEGALFLIISLGLLIGTIIKNMFAYLSIPVILLLSLSLPFDKAGSSLNFDTPKLHLLAPFDYMFIETPYEGIWGIHRVFESAVIHQVSVFFIGILVVFITSLVFYKNRLGNKEKKVLSLLISFFAILAITFGVVRYLEYDQALAQFIATGETYAESFQDSGESEYHLWWNSYYDEHLDDEPYEFSIEQANLKVELQTDHQLNVHSELQIKNNGNEPANEVYITLYHGLKIAECSSSELEMNCSRDQDFITLHFEEAILPEQEVAVTLLYKGDILQYQYDANVEQAFIDKYRIFLPKESGWYPLIGKRPLVIAREHEKHYVKFEMRFARLVEDVPSDYTVEIQNDDLQIPLALTIPKVDQGLYRGTSQYGLALIGGHLQETEIEQIRVVAHPEILKGAEKNISTYQKAWTFVENWLELSITPSTIYILDDEHYHLISNTINHDFFALNSRAVSDEDVTYDILKDIMRGREMEYRSDVDILADAIEWSIMNQLQEEPSFIEWYKKSWWSDEEIPTLVHILGKYENENSDKFYDIVKYLYHYWNQLDDKLQFDMESAIQAYEGESKL